MSVRSDPALDSKPDPDPERLFRILPAIGPDLILLLLQFFLESTVHMYNAYACAHLNIVVMKGTQEWEFLGLRFSILYFFKVSNAYILRLCKKFLHLAIIRGNMIVLRILRVRRTKDFEHAIGTVPRRLFVTALQ